MPIIITAVNEDDFQVEGYADEIDLMYMIPIDPMSDNPHIRNAIAITRDYKTVYLPLNTFLISKAFIDRASAKPPATCAVIRVGPNTDCIMVFAEAEYYAYLFPEFAEYIIEMINTAKTLALKNAVTLGNA